MGEIPKNIYVVGCPSIDSLLSEKIFKKFYFKKIQNRYTQTFFNYNTASSYKRTKVNRKTNGKNN